MLIHKGWILKEIRCSSSLSARILQKPKTHQTKRKTLKPGGGERFKRDVKYIFCLHDLICLCHDTPKC